MKIIRGTLSTLAAAAIPIFLIISAVRLIFFNPLMPPIEYNLPKFPPDEYGFTTADRIHWADISLQYLLGGEDIDFLSRQKLPDGRPLFNERELSHMVDVQRFYQLLISVWTAAGIFLIAYGLVAWRMKWLPSFWMAVSTGGWITLGLIALILVGVFIGFSGLFTIFHRIFFSGDSWLFLYSDSLIRLFPLKLWQDGFTAAGILAGIFGLIAALVPRRWSQA